MKDQKRNIVDSPFFVLMGHFGDIAALSVIWLICSLPIITIGASTTAAFAVAGKMAAKQNYSVWSGFFTAFKRDWLFATKVWLPLAVCGVIIIADYQIGTANPGSLGGALIAASAVLGLMWICLFGGSFALLGRFSYASVTALLRDAAKLCIANIPATLGYLALALFMPLFHIFIPALYYYIRLPWLFLGGGIIIVAFSYMLRPAFIKLEKK